MSTQPLWPQPIPVLGGTGAVGSGKTRFGLAICPGPETLVYDLEQSSASYSYLGFERVDVQKEMQKWCDAQNPKKKGYKASELWLWWLDHVRSLPSNKYRVIMVDPVTDLENGLVDWVEANPGYFGHTAGQYASMSGIKWGDVKALEKMVLADICAKCETFYFTAHIGAVWGSDKKPTGQMKAKGKESLDQLASLYLWFKRDPDPKTGERPKMPSAIVRKGRFDVPKLNADGSFATNEFGDVVTYEVLPPVLPAATPGRIRWYFANPIGRTGLQEAERAREEVVTLSADERLKLEVARAEAERDAAQARATVAQSQHTTVPIVIGPKAAEFETMIRGATDPNFLLETVGPQIKVASDAGQVNPTEVEYLRGVFNACGKRLRESQTAA